MTYGSVFFPRILRMVYTTAHVSQGSLGKIVSSTVPATLTCVCTMGLVCTLVMVMSATALRDSMVRAKFCCHHSLYYNIVYNLCDVYR